MSKKPQPLPERVLPLNPSAKVMYLYLSRRSGRGYSLRNLAEAVGMSLEATRTGLDDLESAGVLTRERNSTNPAILHITRDLD